MTKYLAADVNASVPAIRLICLYLASAGPSSTGQIAEALAPKEVIGQDNADGQRAEKFVAAALNVAADLGFVSSPARPGGEYSISSTLAGSVRLESLLGNAHEFRPRVRSAIGSRALEQVRAGGSPSDVALGLTWLLSLDPLDPLSWEDPLSLSVNKHMRQHIVNGEQWNAFRRWATSVGLANRLATSKRPVLQVTAVQCVSAFVAAMPQELDAGVFLSSLLDENPLLGHPELLQALPESARPLAQPSVSPSIAQALMSLQEAGQLELVRSEDATRAMTLVVAGETQATIRAVRATGRSTA